jgi:hypothetical protein
MASLQVGTIYVLNQHSHFELSLRETRTWSVPQAQRHNSSFATELALNVLSCSYLFVYLRLLLRVQPAIWHTFIPSHYVPHLLVDHVRSLGCDAELVSVYDLGQLLVPFTARTSM